MLGFEAKGLNVNQVCAELFHKMGRVENSGKEADVKIKPNHQPVSFEGGGRGKKVKRYSVGLNH